MGETHTRARHHLSSAGKTTVPQTDDNSVIDYRGLNGNLEALVECVLACGDGSGLLKMTFTDVVSRSGVDDSRFPSEYC